MDKGNILKQIFFDENRNWDNFKKANNKNIREIVIKEVEKFRTCGEKESGFSLYACELCGDTKVVPHRCKGRFCSVCATGYTQEWSRKTAENMYNMPQNSGGRPIHTKVSSYCNAFSHLQLVLK